MKWTLSLLFLFFLGCSKSYDKSLLIPAASRVETLAKDKMFINLISSLKMRTQVIKNPELAKSILSKNHLSLEDIKDLSNSLGFVDEKKFISFIYDINRSIKIISTKYSLTELSKDEKIAIFEKTSRIMGREYSACESIRVNCIASVSAQSLAMHFACASIDLSVVGGIVCHGAAFVYQYTQSNICNAEAEKCNNVN